MVSFQSVSKRAAVYVDESDLSVVQGQGYERFAVAGQDGRHVVAVDLVVQ